MTHLLQQHLTPEEITLALAGALPAARQEAFEQHRRECKRCAAACAAQSLARQTLAHLGPEPAMPAPLDSRLQKLLAKETQPHPTSAEATQSVLDHFPTSEAGSKPTLASTRPARRVAAHRVVIIALAALLALALMAGSVYSVTSLLNQVIDSDPGTKQVDLEHLYVPVNQSQTIDGFTVKLEKAYADANRVIVAVTFKEPAGHTYNNVFMLGTKMTANQNVTLPMLGGSGSGNRQAANAFVLWFDGAAISGAPKTLSLHLTATGLNVAQQDGDQSTFKDYTISGAISFDFTIPFHAGRVANLHQSLTAGGTTLTLERVVVTLSETRIYLQGSLIGFATRLSVGNWNSDTGPVGSVVVWPTADGMTMISYGASLFNQHGSWTLKIWASGATQVKSGTPVTGGPWTFHFNVP